MTATNIPMSSLRSLGHKLVVMLACRYLAAGLSVLAACDADGQTLKVAREPAAAASQAEWQQSVSNCPADRPQRVLASCMTEEIEAADRRIDARLKASIGSLSTAGIPDRERKRAQINFLKGQAAWREYREKSCLAALLYLDNGDAGELEYLDCKRRLAEHRLHDFDLYGRL